ncbi:MAG: hypothetical protein ABL974_00345 [Prosthecobacter sp.]
MCRRSLAAFILSVFILAPVVQADVPLPPNVLDPKTPAEAWNVIRLSRANVARLLQEKRVSEVPEQVSLCSPSLRLLAHATVSAEQRLLVDEQTSRAFSSVNSIAQSCMVRSQPDANKAFIELQSALTKLESVFDAADVSAEIYYCTTHPEIIATASGTTCRKCAAPLRIRRIPYSFVYVAPGTPTLKLSLTDSAPLVAGRETKIQMHLSTTSGQPVSESDLLIVHSKPIHLLITNPALSAFQTVHPVSAGAAGDYTFSFTPSVDGPCRVWADIVPVTTGLQELPFADIGGVFSTAAPQKTTEVRTTTIEGFTFEISFAGITDGQPHAGQIQLMRIKATDSSGKPVERLEPLMNAFAQVVGFYADHQTVLRLHPIGGDILREELRGGPYLGFKIYPPRAGLVRFYCQVRIDGRTITVPLSVNVVE